MMRAATVLLIAVLGTAAYPARADVPGTYKPGYKPSFQPKPSAPATYRPQGERPKPPSFQPAPKPPTFSAPPSPPTKSYTPPGSR